MKKIKTNVDFLDHMLDGGFRKGYGLNGIVGLTCVGKTSLLLRIGINMYEQDYKVVVFNSGDRNKFFNLRANNNINGKFILYEVYDLNFERIKKIVDSIKPDIILIDDFDLTYNDEVDKLLELNTTVLYTKSVFNPFKNVLPRELALKSDVIISLSRTSAQQKLSLLDINLIKSRDKINQPENYKNIEVDYKNMTFTYPSKIKRFINKIKLLWWKYLKN